MLQIKRNFCSCLYVTIIKAFYLQITEIANEFLNDFHMHQDTWSSLIHTYCFLRYSCRYAVRISTYYTAILIQDGIPQNHDRIVLLRKTTNIVRGLDIHIRYHMSKTKYYIRTSRPSCIDFHLGQASND